jgi:hypothetical protein
MAESAEDLHQSIQAEFGWGDIVLLDEKGNDITEDTVLEGTTLRFAEYQNRQKTVLAKFPEEDSRTSVIDGTGKKIQDWVEEQEGVSCSIVITCRGCRPAQEDLDDEEYYTDVKLKITPKGSLPEVEAHYHSLTRNPCYHQRREDKKWGLKRKIA